MQYEYCIAVCIMDGPVKYEHCTALFIVEGPLY